MDRQAIRAKYPKWAHRRDYHKKARRRSRRRRRRKRRRGRAAAPVRDTTELMLVQLLNQLLLVPRTLAKKHGENVLTGYADAVRPDKLAPVRSREEHRRLGAAPGAPHGAGAGAFAMARHAEPGPMPD